MIINDCERLDRVKDFLLGVFNLFNWINYKLVDDHLENETDLKEEKNKI